MNPMRDINMHQSGCTTKVWSGRDTDSEPLLTCGNTGWFGDVVSCSECDKKWNIRYPNGIPYSAEDDYDDEGY